MDYKNTGHKFDNVDPPFLQENERKMDVFEKILVLALAAVQLASY